MQSRFGAFLMAILHVLTLPNGRKIDLFDNRLQVFRVKESQFVILLPESRNFGCVPAKLAEQAAMMLVIGVSGCLSERQCTYQKYQRLGENRRRFAGYRVACLIGHRADQPENA